VLIPDPDNPGEKIAVNREFVPQILMRTGRPSGITTELVVDSLDNVEAGFGFTAIGFGAAGQAELAVPAAGISAGAKALKVMIQPPAPREFGAGIIDQAISEAIPNPAGKAFVDIVGPTQRIEELSR